MIRIDRNIRELLYKHECVIIPGLGGIISKYDPAVIHKNTHRITPPSRALSFNRHLRNNDGLLINHVSVMEKISYESSRALVEEYVSRCHKSLSEQKEFTLQGIGSLALNDEGHMTFAPDPGANYLASSYGLRPVNASPVDSEPKLLRNYPSRIDRKPAADRQTTPAPVRWTLAFALPVIAFLLWGIIRPDSVQRVYTQTAGHISDVAYFSRALKSSSAADVDNLPVEVNIPVVHLLSKPSGITPPPRTAFRLPAEVEKELSPGLPMYHIIGASYVRMGQAERFAARLAGEDYEPRIIGTEEEGRIRVSYYSFADKKAALEKLEIIREQKNASAWLLRY